MTITSLMDNLADFLKPAVKEYCTQQRTGEIPIEVFAGYPPIRTDTRETASFVYALVVSAEDTADEKLSTATVEIGFSIYDEDKTDGWRSLFNLIEHIRQHILKYRLVGAKNRMEFPVKVKIADEQPYPQWQGMITVSYTIGQPSEEGLDYDDYGATNIQV